MDRSDSVKFNQISIDVDMTKFNQILIRVRKARPLNWIGRLDLRHRSTRYNLWPEPTQLKHLSELSHLDLKSESTCLDF